MSAKRFFILKDCCFDDVLPCIRDKEDKIKDIYGHYKYDDLEEICGELNALHEENQELKREVGHLNYRFTEYRSKLKSITREEVKETLQKHYDDKLGNDRLLEEIAEELRVDLE